jgi:hypothetical protein
MVRLFGLKTVRLKPSLEANFGLVSEVWTAPSSTPYLLKAWLMLPEKGEYFTKLSLFLLLPTITSLAVYARDLL